jgi:FkbM family methyltransferase
MLCLKRVIGAFLSSSLVGSMISIVFAKSIPSIRMRRIRINNSPSIKSSIKAQFFFGLYESGEIRFIKRFLSLAENVIELGASVGVISSYINLYKKPKKLILVEANPSLIMDLKSNLKINGASDYTLYNKAITDGSSNLIQFSEGEDNTTGGLFKRNTGGASTVVVKTTLFDEILKANAIDSYVLVSDIEGAEIFVLNSASGLKGCKMLIMELHEIEYNGKIVSVSSMKQQIKDLGFEILGNYGPLIAARRTTLGN